MRIAFQVPVIHGLGLSRVVESQDTWGAWRPEHPFHLTVLHLGKIEELASEISGNSDAGVCEEVSALKRFANAIAAAWDPTPKSIEAQEIRVWNNPGKAFLVLVLEPQDWMVQLREVLVQETLDFLGSRGVENPSLFLEESSAAGFRESWVPHVTLGFKVFAEPFDLFEVRARLSRPINFTLAGLLPSSYGTL